MVVGVVKISSSELFSKDIFNFRRRKVNSRMSLGRSVSGVSPFLISSQRVSKAVLAQGLLGPDPYDRGGLFVTCVVSYHARGGLMQGVGSCKGQGVCLSLPLQHDRTRAEESEHFVQFMQHQSIPAHVCPS